MGVKGDKNGWVWRHLWVSKETKMGGYRDIYGCQRRQKWVGIETFIIFCLHYELFFISLLIIRS